MLIFHLLTGLWKEIQPCSPLSCKLRALCVSVCVPEEVICVRGSSNSQGEQDKPVWYATLIHSCLHPLKRGRKVYHFHVSGGDLRSRSRRTKRRRKIAAILLKKGRHSFTHKRQAETCLPCIPLFRFQFAVILGLDTLGALLPTCTAASTFRRAGNNSYEKQY